MASKKKQLPKVTQELAARFSPGLYVLPGPDLLENPKPDGRSDGFWDKDYFHKGSRLIIGVETVPHLKSWRERGIDIDYKEMYIQVSPDTKRSRYKDGEKYVFAQLHSDGKVTVPSDEPHSRYSDVQYARIAVILENLERLPLTTAQYVIDYYDMERWAMVPALTYLVNENKLQIEDLIEAGKLCANDDIWVKSGMQEEDPEDN